MDETTYQKLKAANAEEREKLAAKAARIASRQAELARDDEALDRVWQMLGNPVQPSIGETEAGFDLDVVTHISPPATFREAVEQASNRGELIANIRAIIHEVPPHTDFNSEWVRIRLAQTNPELSKRIHRSSVPGTLAQLLGTELTLVERGSGRRSSTFRRRPVLTQPN
jgi:hypothetical protein